MKNKSYNRRLESSQSRNRNIGVFEVQNGYIEIDYSQAPETIPITSSDIENLNNYHELKSSDDQDSDTFDPVIYWGHLVQLWIRHNLANGTHLGDITDDDFMLERSILFWEQIEFLNSIAARDLHESIDQIKALAYSVDFSRSEAIYSLILEIIAECMDDIQSLSAVSQMNFLHVSNKVAYRKLSLVLQVLIQQFSHLNLNKPILQADLGPAEIVELADAMHHHKSFNGKKPIHVYRAFGRLFGNISSDDTYKNTSVKNKNRDNKSIFLSSLIKEYEKSISVK